MSFAELGFDRVLTLMEAEKADIIPTAPTVVADGSTGPVSWHSITSHWR
jgi:hypothetical protein